jgi:hypothetical protein
MMMGAIPPSLTGSQLGGSSHMVQLSAALSRHTRTQLQQQRSTAAAMQSRHLGLLLPAVVVASVCAYVCGTHARLRGALERLAAR